MSPPSVSFPTSLSATQPRLLHVTTGLEIGGGEVLLLNLTEAARRAGMHSVVVSLIADGPMRRRFAAVGIEVRDLGMARGRPTFGGLLKLARIIRELAPDVVQGWLYHGNVAATAALLLSGRRGRTGLVHGVYGSSLDFRAYGLGMRASFGLAALASRFADAIVYNTVVGAAYHRRHGFQSAREEMIGNGIDANRFITASGQRAETRRSLGLGEAEVAAIAVARVDPMKGWELLLDVTERIPGMRLIAVGRGTESFPPHPSRLLLGAREDIPALLAAADVFVLPSLFGEGTSVALTEAMAAGLPAVVTDVGDNAITAEGCGLTVPPGDPAPLEQALRGLAADPEERRRLGEAARAKAVREYGIDKALEHYYRLYADVRR